MPSLKQMLLFALVATATQSCAPQSESQKASMLAPPQQTSAAVAALGATLVRTCPERDADQGPKARDLCAEKLGKMAQLARVMPPNGLRWGGTINASFNPDTDKLTRLDGLVWRKLYLSLFAFSNSSVETRPNGDILLRLDGRIRPIAPEEYPYPFWHSADKWRDYQQSRQVGLLFRGGYLIAGYRNAKLDTTIAFTPKVWDGHWTWDVNGQQGTRVSLYSYVLSPGNPNRPALETAYRDFEAAARPHFCVSCHNPANPKGMNPLVFFTHPGQALTVRHQIVDRLEANTMPPNGGISDPV